MFTTKNLPCIMDLDLVLSLDFNFKKWLFDIIFHKGRTDVSGGHTDYINQSRLGMYHYHHGIFPHLHPDSKCPYESEQTFIINPYNGKKVGIGPPYVFEDEKYYSVHLVTKALARIDSMGGLKSFSDNKGGTFYICSTGQSSIASFYEEFTFSYPRFLLMIKDNALFKTENEELQLLCHNKGLDGDSGYVYITLKELRRYMIKNAYFTDLCDDGKDVWSFKIDFGIDIDSPEKGTLLKVDNIVAVRATINNVAYAKLTIGKHSEFKNNLENQTEVVFSDYVIHNDDIGNLDIKVEVGMFVNLPLASHVVQVLVEGSGNITKQQLEQMIKPYSDGGISLNTKVEDLDKINDVLKKYGIDTPEKMKHFFAQVAHESKVGLIEKYNGNSPEEYFADRDFRAEYGHNAKGDGAKYRGAGYIQLTWKSTYQDFANYVGDQDIVSKGATYVADNYAWEAAGWFWQEYKGINTLIDNGATVKDVTKKVNGGSNGLDERTSFYDRLGTFIK